MSREHTIPAASAHWLMTIPTSHCRKAFVEENATIMEHFQVFH